MLVKVLLVLRNAYVNENKPRRMNMPCDQFICFRTCWGEAIFTSTEQMRDEMLFL